MVHAMTFESDVVLGNSLTTDRFKFNDFRFESDVVLGNSLTSNRVEKRYNKFESDVVLGNSLTVPRPSALRSCLRVMLF